MRRIMQVVAVAIVAGGVATTGRAAGDPNTTITSKRLDFDYARFIAVFEGDVVVVDPQIRMEADKMNVVFEGSNSVKSVSASGRVRISQEDKLATCQRALYVARTGEVQLRGDAVLSRGGDRVMGDEITFWLNEDRMTVTPGRLIITPKSQSGGMPGSGARKPAPTAKAPAPTPVRMPPPEPSATPTRLKPSAQTPNTN